MTKEEKEQAVAAQQKSSEGPVIDAIKELTKQVTALTKEVKELHTYMELKFKAGKF